MARRLAGKVALITGGSSGMGAATVRLYAAEGARVFFGDIAVETGEALARETGAHFMEHDVADDLAWRGVMASIAETAGRLDIVMNNAAMLPGRSIEEIDLATWNRAIAVNQTGVMLGCQHAIRAMRANSASAGGSIINVASTAAFASAPGECAYPATKGAVMSLTRAVAIHCARRGYGIRCNSIVPGPILTGMMRQGLGSDPAALERMEQMAPLGRVGRPEEIALMAVYLGSDESSFCTGGDYRVDGGVMASHPGL